MGEQRLMTFFFVLGLEARRELDLGDFRERRRFLLPLLASVGGMGGAAAIYLAFNLGGRRRPGRVLGVHDQLLEHQDKLRMADPVSYADRLGLDVARFTEELQGHVGANRIAQDVEGADLSPRAGTPTFFIDGRRHHGAYDIDTLSSAVRAAGARAKLAAS